MTTHDKDAGNVKRTRKAVVPDHLQPLATALGTLAMAWGGLEQTIAAIMVTMLRLPSLKGAIVAGNIELIPQIRIIRHIAVVLKLNKNLYDNLKSDLSLVENHLCKERNRMFHDLWISDGSNGKMNRVTLKPDLDRTDPTNWKFKRDKKQMSELEVSDLTLQVNDAHVRLQSVLRDVEQHLAQSTSPDK